MISNKEVIERVVDRYNVYELVEVLDIEDRVDEDVLDSDIEDFAKVYKKTIINNQQELDIW